ncbi:hypothetical protein NPIL_386521 [Nephila pilipes]|uniref:Uncharacterized protein n=1 Tax=Nephila pilipes TaxID=299642 RepID=A0A8X6PKY8_NEPPI|nr:hypothetical protein NPIL_386521 [Nephila pilipes]
MKKTSSNLGIDATMAESTKRYQNEAEKRKKKFKRKLEIAENQKNALHKFLGATTSVPLSSTSYNPQCISNSNIFPDASSEVRPFIPSDSVQNKADDSEKGDNEEVQSNNESNRDMKSEEDKDRPERFIDLDVEMLNDIALWPTTLTDLLIEITSNTIRKKPNNIDNIETLKSVYIDRDPVYYRGLSYDHFYTHGAPNVLPPGASN